MTSDADKVMLDELVWIVLRLVEYFSSCFGRTKIYLVNNFLLLKVIFDETL
jgi:hypothetical protein